MGLNLIANRTRIKYLITCPECSGACVKTEGVSVKTDEWSLLEQRRREETQTDSEGDTEHSSDEEEDDWQPASRCPLWKLSLSRTEQLLRTIADSSEVEDFSDGEGSDPAVDELFPQNADLMDEQPDSSDEDSESQPLHPPEHRRGPERQHVESDDLDEDEPRPEQKNAGHGERWRRWQPLDYVEQYMDSELMKVIADCTNAMSLVNTGTSLQTSVVELYHFFGAAILMSCVPYPQTKMYWSNGLQIPAISDTMSRDRFFKLRSHLKVVIDDHVSENRRKDDKFWKNPETPGERASASVTRADGKVCVVKWYDHRPVVMLSTVHSEQPEDTYQRWSKKDKQYATVTRPNIIREHKTKMEGVDTSDRMMRHYRMCVRTQKWTHRLLMHFTDLALVNSWMLYRRDNLERGTPKKTIMTFLQFRMVVAQVFLSKRTVLLKALISKKRTKTDTFHRRTKSLASSRSHTSQSGPARLTCPRWSPPKTPSDAECKAAPGKAACDV
ncbi:hypothetical protein WMY93_008369 [Mugilogobius chulae]|uniref:PiggyBac transposable element-derived protein domain-containing protein n=1 Tax=Mugilogobius chulae TaxID=88201 RepID=A0AAW0PFS1_9GOBI